MNPELLTQRQRLALLWLGAVSPVFQRLPGELLRGGAGAAAWLSPVFALVPLGLTALLLHRLLLPGEGLGEGLCRCVGRFPGRGLGLVLAGWAFLLCAGALRAGAEVFCYAVFPRSSAAVFLPVMAGLGLMGALGRLRTLGRMAEAVLPFLALGLALALLPGLGSIEAENLRITDGETVPAAARGALRVTDTVSAAAFAAFLPGERAGSRAHWLRAFLSLGLMGLLLCAVTLGRLGPELAGTLPYPFFLLLRDLRFLHLLDRTEALLCAQWVFTDFFLTAVLLSAGGRCAALCLGERSRKWVIGLGCAGALGLAWLAPAGLWEVLPAGNALFFALLTAALFIGRLRSTI